mgnify:CR=1 FL=1
MAVVEFKNEKGLLEYHVNDISSYEGFDSLVEFFTAVELGVLLDIKEGPGTRLALIEFGSVKIQLVFSDQIGNYFYAVDVAGCAKAKELAKDIEDRIAENN